MEHLEKQKRIVPEPKTYHFHHSEDWYPISPVFSGWNSGYCLWLIFLLLSQEHLWYINPQQNPLMYSGIFTLELWLFFLNKVHCFLHSSIALYSTKLLKRFYKHILSRTKLIFFPNLFRFKIDLIEICLFRICHKIKNMVKTIPSHTH